MALGQPHPVDEHLRVLRDIAAEIECELDATVAELRAVRDAGLPDLGVDIGIVERELREQVAALAWCASQLSQLQSELVVE